MKKVSDQIADWLVANGVEQVFAVTGGGAMFLNQSLGAHPHLRCTFMHHEQACAMAAEGYARIAGKPAVVMLTTGPGAINAMNGVFGAYTDSIPMIVLSGQVKRETCVDFNDLQSLRQLGDQEGPTVKMAAPITKYAVLIREAEQIGTELPKAFKIATNGRPGPVWLDIPLDIQSSTTQLAFASWKESPSKSNEKLKEFCETIVERLRSSDRPLILGGTGVRLSNAVGRLRSFIEKYNLPLATAWTHDLIESDHPLFAGRPGTIGTRAGNFCLQNADFVLVLGSRLNIRQTGYNLKAFGKNACVAQVDIDKNELNKPTFKPQISVEADVSEFLEILEKALEDTGLPDYSVWVAWCQTIRERFPPELENIQDPAAALNPYHVVSRIFELLEEDDIIVCGNASACIIPFQVGKLKKGQRLFSNSGSASMGYDLPAAIGAAMASIPNRRVICFSGDGSLMMNLQELQTLKTIAANIVIIVLNNGGYLSIRQTHENFFGRVVGATPETGVGFPEFYQVAKAFGVDSVRIAALADLGGLQNAMNRSGPLLIEMLVDKTQNFAPRIKSKLNDQGKFETPELDDMYPFLGETEIQNIREAALQIISKSTPEDAK